MSTKLYRVLTNTYSLHVPRTMLLLTVVESGYAVKFIVVDNIVNSNNCKDIFCLPLFVFISWASPTVDVICSDSPCSFATQKGVFEVFIVFRKVGIAVNYDALFPLFLSLMGNHQLVACSEVSRVSFLR